MTRLPAQLTELPVSETDLVWITRTVAHEEHGYLGMVLHLHTKRFRFIAIHEEMSDLIDDSLDRLYTRIARGAAQIGASR